MPRQHVNTPWKVRSLLLLAVTLAGVFGPKTLHGQVILAASGTTASTSTYVFSGGGAIMSSPLTEGSGNIGSGNSFLDLANGTSLIISLGTFVNSGTVAYASGGRALQFQYSLAVDKGDTGAVVVLFDSNASGSINSGDKGFAFNVTSNNNDGVVPTTTTAFSIAVTGTGTAAYSPSTLAFTSAPWPAATGTSGYNYQQTVGTFPNSSGTVAASFAVLLADIDSTLEGKTALVTFFTTQSPLSTAAGATAFGSTSGLAVQDWYGSGTTTTTVFSTVDGSAGTVLIPESSTWTTSGALVGIGGLAWWRRRRRAAAAPTTESIS